MRKKFLLLTIVTTLILLFCGCKNIGTRHTATFTLLQTSDIHNHAGGYGASLDYTPENNGDTDGVLGGYTRLASLIEQVRQEKEEEDNPVVLVDSGDFFMGTVYDLDTANPITLAFMNWVGYDAVTLGNHEFDWSPGGLGLLLNNGIANGFTVPIIATNMVTSNMLPGDDDIEALEKEGVIAKKRVLELANGLKIGILGILGMDADSKAPATQPITFKHDYGNLQMRVDALRNVDGVDIVILLSHGGVTSEGDGDDTHIAENISGIDIIASGHYHTATTKPFTRGEGKTLIFSPGEYGQWLSRLDVTYNTESRSIKETRFTLIPVDDTVSPTMSFEDRLKTCRDFINRLLAPFEFSLNMPVSRVSGRMNITGGEESGLGNLVADAVRAAASKAAPFNDGAHYDVAVVPNGVIRDGFFPGKTGAVSFTDVYNNVPLGISPDEGQVLPGYPLISCYVTGPDLRNICEAGLSVGKLLGPDYYLNFSGIRVEYNPDGAQQFQGVKVVYLSPANDRFTEITGPAVDLTDTQTLYHVVVNYYSLLMLEEITGMGLPIIPRDAGGAPLDPNEYIFYRIDAGEEPGVRELKEWMALLGFLRENFPYPGTGIPPAIYGDKGTGMGRITNIQ